MPALSSMCLFASAMTEPMNRPSCTCKQPRVHKVSAVPVCAVLLLPPHPQRPNLGRSAASCYSTGAETTSFDAFSRDRHPRHTRVGELLQHISPGGRRTQLLAVSSEIASPSWAYHPAFPRPPLPCHHQCRGLPRLPLALLANHSLSLAKTPPNHRHQGRSLWAVGGPQTSSRRSCAAVKRSACRFLEPGRRCFGKQPVRVESWLGSLDCHFGKLDSDVAKHAAVRVHKRKKNDVNGLRNALTLAADPLTW